MPRFAILEHTDAPDDPSGRHFDLLIEAGEACRTWRLVALPAPGGQPVAAFELPLHRLAWLDHEAGEVSGGRGFATRIASGTCHVLAGDDQNADLVIKGAIAGRDLRLTPAVGGWVAAVDR